jgi:hypothetical protein
MSDRPELKPAPGSRDSELPWTAPHAEPTKHDETRIQAPDVKQDLDPHTPGQLGGEPSVGWQVEDE